MLTLHRKKSTPWYKRIFKSRTRKRTPIIKRIKRAFVNFARTQKPSTDIVHSWIPILKSDEMSIISTSIFSGSALIEGYSMAAHMSMITQIFGTNLQIVQVAINDVTDGYFNVKDMNVSPESCCLTYIGANFENVRRMVVDRITYLRKNYSYSSIELCRVVANRTCEERDPQRLNTLAKDTKKQQNIICSGIFLHVYIEVFTELGMDMSVVFPLNPFACTPSRIVDVLKNNPNWSLVNLKPLLLISPLLNLLPFDIHSKEYKTFQEYLSTANCRLIGEEAHNGTCEIIDAKHMGMANSHKSVRFYPGIYDLVQKKMLLKPLLVCNNR